MFNYLKLITLFLVFILLNTNYSYSNASDDTTEIGKISYEGYLSNNTIIKINGSNLSKCTNLLVNSIEVKIFDNNINYVSFKFSDVLSNNGKIELKCGKNNNFINYYSFPYIKEIKGLEYTKKNIIIKGENFGFNGNVILEGGSFKKDISQNTIITGDVSDNISGNDIYVEINGLKSNLRQLPVKLPKIDFIYSKEAFLNNTKIFIYGENLNFYKNAKIIYDGIKSTNFNYDKKNGFISFISNSDLGKKTIQINSNGFISNGIEIDNVGKQAILENIFYKKVLVKDDLSEHIEEMYVIKGKNFTRLREDINVFNNGKIVSIYKIIGDEIYLNNVIFDRGENLFSVIINGNSSNILNIQNDYDLPYISSIEVGNIENEKRSIKIFVNDFDEKDGDKIYFNNSEIKPVGCMSNMCRVEISKNILEGNFSVGRDGYINTRYREFNIIYDKIPFIDYVNVIGNFEQGSIIEIIGDNFLDSNISITNLFDNNNRDKLDIEVSNSTITGRIPFSYDFEKNTKISIEKYGKTSYIDFVGNEIEGKKIYGRSYIKIIESLSDDGLFKAGGKIKLYGKGFKQGDIIVIGDVKTNLNVLNNNNGTFIVPLSLKEGEYDIFIEGINGFDSNKITEIILSQNSKGDIGINSLQITKNNFYIKEDNTDSIYNLDIKNRINDLIINNISYEVENYKISDFLGTFDLFIGNKKVATTLIDDEGKINFVGSFILEKNINNTKVELKKSSEYIIEKDFKINFLKKNFKVKNLITNKKFVNIDYSIFYPNNIKLETKSIIRCIDSLNDNLNCNNFLGFTGTKENEKNNESNKINITEKNETNIIEKEENSIEDKYDKVYIRIDNITENLSSKYSTLTILEQLDKFKKLKFKIKKVLTKYKDSNNKIFIEYFYSNINTNYKKKFKEYILSKK